MEGERGTRWPKWRGEASSLAFILSDFCIVIVSLGSQGSHISLGCASQRTFRIKGGVMVDWLLDAAI